MASFLNIQTRDKKERHAGKIALTFKIRAILSGLPAAGRYLIPDNFRFRTVPDRQAGIFLQSGKIYEEKFRNDGLGDDYEVFRKPYPELTLSNDLSGISTFRLIAV